MFMIRFINHNSVRFTQVMVTNETENAVYDRLDDAVFKYANGSSVNAELRTIHKFVHDLSIESPFISWTFVHGSYLHSYVSLTLLHWF